MLFFKRKYLSVPQITDRIKGDIPFGLFDVHNDLGGTWQFKDGTKMKETALWEALRKIHDLQPGHGKTLKQLCPHTYVGTFKHKYIAHRWHEI